MGAIDSGAIDVEEFLASGMFLNELDSFSVCGRTAGPASLLALFCSNDLLLGSRQRNRLLSTMRLLGWSQNKDGGAHNFLCRSLAIDFGNKSAGSFFGRAIRRENIPRRKEGR